VPKACGIRTSLCPVARSTVERVKLPADLQIRDIGVGGATVMFQSAPGIAASGNPLVTAWLMPARMFQSAPGLAARETRSLRRLAVALGRFHPPPASRPGETLSPAGRQMIENEVSIRPRPRRQEKRFPTVRKEAPYLTGPETDITADRSLPRHVAADIAISDSASDNRGEHAAARAPAGSTRNYEAVVPSSDPNG